MGSAFSNIESAPQHQRTYGLRQVFPESGKDGSGESRESVDIIAIHGLDTHSPETWVAWKKDGDAASGEVHWLKDQEMLPAAIPNARIFTYDWNANFDQDSGAQKLLGHADSLLEILHIHRGEEHNKNPIIFIASCFGGLLLIKALHRACESNSPYQDILRSTIGVAFLGTPFRGSDKGFFSAVQLRIAVALSMGCEVSDELIHYLENDDRGNRELDELVQRFCELTAGDGFKFNIRCFYESRRTDFTKVIKNLPPKFRDQLTNKSGILVNEHSACLQGFPRSALDVRHVMMNKYSDPKGAPFRILVYYLKNWAENAQETLNRKKQFGTFEFRTINPFTIPFQPDEKFKELPGLIKRETVLSNIDQLLSQSKDSPNVLTLYGITGIGKTQLAASFIRRHQTDYTAIFTITGRSEAEFRQGLVSLAPKVQMVDEEVTPLADTGEGLGVALTNPNIEEETIGKVINWLNLANNTKWLLVIDDLLSRNTSEVGEAFDIIAYLKRLVHGTIIMTSQRPNISYHHSHYLVPCLNTEQGLELMEKRILSSRGFDDADYKPLLSQLQYHSLSVDSAACLIAQDPSMTPERYLEEWSRANIEILRSEPDYATHASIYRTMDIVLSRLPRGSRLFLQLCAYLDENDIWFDMFHGATQNDHPPWLHEIATDLSKFQKIIKTLSDLSLLHPSPKRYPDPRKHSYVIHTAVHKCARHLSGAFESESKLINIVLDIVASVVSQSAGQKNDHGEQLRRMIPHAARCKARLDLLSDDGEQLCFETLVNLRRLGSLYRYQGLLKEAEEIYIKITSAYEGLILEKPCTETPRQLDTAPRWDSKPQPQSSVMKIEQLWVLNGLGLVYLDQGKSSAAIIKFSTVLSERKASMESTNPAIFSAQHCLALAYSQKKDWKRALPLFTEALDGLSKLEPSHKDWIRGYAVMAGLGRVYTQLKDYHQAENYFNQAWSGFNSQFQHLHSWVFFVAREQGLLYRNQKKWKISEEKLIFALSGYTELWGENSRLTLETEAYLANLYRHMLRNKKCDLKRTNDAFKSLIDKQKRILGRHDHHTLKSLHCNGLAFLSAHELTKAEGMVKAELCFWDALAGYKTLPDNDYGYERTCTTIELANILAFRGHHKQAQEFYTQAIDWYSLDIDNYSRKRLETMLSRVAVLERQELWNDAENDLEEVLRVNKILSAAGLCKSHLDAAVAKLKRLKHRRIVQEQEQEQEQMK